jgi:hypothetical protein
MTLCQCIECDIQGATAGSKCQAEGSHRERAQTPLHRSTCEGGSTSTPKDPEYQNTCYNLLRVSISLQKGVGGKSSPSSKHNFIPPHLRSSSKPFTKSRPAPVPLNVSQRPTVSTQKSKPRYPCPCIALNTNSRYSPNAPLTALAATRAPDGLSHSPFPSTHSLHLLNSAYSTLSFFP